MSELIQEYWLIIVCGCLFCVVNVLIMAGLVVFNYTRNVQPTKYWQQAAERAGLSMTRRGSMVSTPALGGVFRKRSVTVYVQVRGGRPARFYTTVRMTVTNSRGLRLMISPNVSMLFRLDYGLGLPDVVKTGDETFDREFVVRCNQPEAATSLPGDSALRQNLASVKSFTTTFLVDLKDTVLEYRQPGIERSPDRLLIALNLAADVTDRSGA